MMAIRGRLPTSFRRHASGAMQTGAGKIVDDGVKASREYRELWHTSLRGRTLAVAATRARPRRSVTGASGHTVRTGGEMSVVLLHSRAMHRIANGYVNADDARDIRALACMKCSIARAVAEIVDQQERRVFCRRPLPTNGIARRQAVAMKRRSQGNSRFDNHALAASIHAHSSSGGV